MRTINEEDALILLGINVPRLPVPSFYDLVAPPTNSIHSRQRLSPAIPEHCWYETGRKRSRSILFMEQRDTLP